MAKPVGEMMEDWAKEAVVLAHEQFKTKLDDAESCVETLEQLLGALHQVIQNGYQTPGMPERPSKEDIWLWSTRYGALLGKLIIQYVGGQWEARWHREVGFGYAIPIGGVNFFPIVKVNDRLTKGESENLVEYFVSLKDLATPGEEDS
jgi:hypothetical protein